MNNTQSSLFRRLYTPKRALIVGGVVVFLFVLVVILYYLSNGLFKGEEPKKNIDLGRRLTFLDKQEKNKFDSWIKKSKEGDDMAEFYKRYVKNFEEEEYGTFDLDEICMSELREFNSWMKEDYMAFSNFFSGMKKPGVYLDVGAATPTLVSNSFFFDTCLGWKGICVEANEANLAFWKKEDHPHPRTCTLVEKAASYAKGFQTFGPGKKGKEGESHHGVAFGEITEEKTEYSVECDTLDNMLEENGITKVDFMSIDIEGGEYNAFKNFDLRKYKVDVIVAENEGDKLRCLMREKGYFRMIRTEKKKFSVHNDWYVRIPDDLVNKIIDNKPL